MAECVATVGAGVSQEMLEAIWKEAEPLNLTPGQWLKRKLAEITGVPVKPRARRERPLLERQLYVRVPESVRERMYAQAKLEGLIPSKWIRRAVERELVRLPTTDVDILLEPPTNEPIMKYPMVQFRGTPELRARLAARAKAEHQSQGTWVRWAILRELGLLGQIPLQWLQESEVTEEDMPGQEWDRLAELEAQSE